MKEKWDSRTRIRIRIGCLETSDLRPRNLRPSCDLGSEVSSSEVSRSEVSRHPITVLFYS